MNVNSLTYHYLMSYTALNVNRPLIKVNFAILKGTRYNWGTEYVGKMGKFVNMCLFSNK